MPEPSQGNTWQNARDKAVEANEKANDAKELLKPVLKNLEDGVSNAKKLSKDIDDTNMNIGQASQQIERVSKILPNLQSLVDELKIKQDEAQKSGNDLANRIELLKKQIEMARELANSIKVGVQFHPNTTLELQTPSNIGQLANDFTTSVYFRTNKTDGLLLYLGNDNKPDGKKYTKDDYMALEIENGYPILSIDLGDGPDKIISKKNVANGKWHQAIVERTGNDVKLTIKEELEDGKVLAHEVQDRLSGNNNIFDLNKDNTRIFVGGSPELNSKELKYNSFEGEIEDLRIGDEKVGLWNFVDAQNNNDGARERNQLTSSEAQPTGYRFSGDGYVILDAKPYSFKQRSNIQFKFKAGPESSDGLMFYAGQKKHFISVELQDGGVYFQYKLGQHLVSIGSSERFNDNEWHHVEAERNGRAGILKVDGKEIRQEESPVGSEENLRISDSMYFGGHPTPLNHSEITSKNFDGCIDEVFISGTPIDLSRNQKAYRARAGCATKFSTILSYPPRQFGYLRHNISANNLLRISLKFKTKQDKGLIFYGTDRSQENNIALWLEDGALVLRSQNFEVSTYPTTFNDSEWHYLSLLHDENKLTLSVDDAPELVSLENTRPLLLEDGDIYFGGLPKFFSVPPYAVNTPAYFVGCISDVYINGPIVNFAESADRKSVLLDSCARDILGNTEI